MSYKKETKHDAWRGMVYKYNYFKVASDVLVFSRMNHWYHKARQSLWALNVDSLADRVHFTNLEN